MLVLPKYADVDHEAPSAYPQSQQAAVQAEMRALAAGRVPGVFCSCECCRAAPSPVAPGRELCYSCLRARCVPSTEQVFVARSYALLDQRRLEWEAKYPHWYLRLAGTWTSESRPNVDEPMGLRHYWQRFFVRRR